jgi:hypothetical protein
MKPRMISLDESQLKAMAGYVGYERGMWDWVIVQLRDDRESSHLRNAYTNEFLLHSRSLTEFLRSEPRKDDVVAAHFVPDWPGKDDDDVAYLVETLEVTNKRWAHISAYRLQEGKEAADLERWNRSVHHLEIAWGRFLRSLTPERRAWFA